MKGLEGCEDDIDFSDLETEITRVEEGVIFEVKVVTLR